MCSRPFTGRLPTPKVPTTRGACSSALASCSTTVRAPTSSPGVCAADRGWTLSDFVIWLFERFGYFAPSFDELRRGFSNELYGGAMARYEHLPIYKKEIARLIWTFFWKERKEP